MTTAYKLLQKVIILLLVCLAGGCTERIEKSLIKDVEKLSSPSGQFTLYRYYVGPNMSFGSGFHAVNITSLNEKPDFGSRDALFFHEGIPVFIEWLSDYKLAVKCVSILQSTPPYDEKYTTERETIKWEKWTFQIEYIKVSEYISKEFIYEGIRTSGNQTILYFKRDSLALDLKAFTLSIDSNKLTGIRLENGWKGKIVPVLKRLELIGTSNASKVILGSQPHFVRINNY